MRPDEEPGDHRPAARPLRRLAIAARRRAPPRPSPQVRPPRRLPQPPHLLLLQMPPPARRPRGV
uniref:Uncharacterized protein n=1 Tax=Arundo donax TaxID=35708 RepID=A0A0A8ZUX6_ARUDO